MEIDVLEEKKNRIVFESKDIGHTLCNSLKKELLNDEHVKVATYSIRHPLVSRPKIIVETDGKEPRKALEDAAKRLKKTVDSFKKNFTKEV